MARRKRYGKAFKKEAVKAVEDAVRAGGTIGDVASSLTSVAGVLAQAGDRAGALAASRDARELVRQLCTQQPTRTEWRDDLAVLDDRIGELVKLA